MDLFNTLRSMQLLLIDDDEWVRDAMQLFFESEGCEIVALETAEEGLAYAADRHFDIMIVDYRLPGMNGIEFINHLPDNQADALKVLITAYGSEELLERAKKSGIHELIPKPFNTEVIETSLNRLITEHIQ